MNLTAYQYYPLGFRSPVRDGFRTETVADVGWAQFYTEVKNNTFKGDEFEIRLRTIEIARRLFGNFYEWLDAQDQNPKISEQAYGLLEDTVAFINTGHRPISIVARLGIIGDQIAHNQYRNPKAVERKTQLRKKLLVPHSEVLFQWVQRPQGINDLMVMLNVLFGDHPQS